MVTNLLGRLEHRLSKVMDPELPFLTVMELGMIRGISMDSDEAVIELTPTYTGCPATDAIKEDLQLAAEEIHPNVRIDLVMTPAWTTDWISEATRVKMAQHGVAPPEGKSADKAFLLGEERGATGREGVDEVEEAGRGRHQAGGGCAEFGNVRELRGELVAHLGLRHIERAGNRAACGGVALQVGESGRQAVAGGVVA